MNQIKSNHQPIKDAVSKANAIYVLFPVTQNPDIIASALALYHSLKASQKHVFIATPGEIDADDTKLPGSDAITDKIGNRNLVISLKVNSRDSIDKVSYNLDESGQTFNLIIQPKKGQAPIDSSDVSYSYAGAQADLVFIVGANRLEDLGYFYEDEKKLFDSATTVALNRSVFTKFAQHHINDQQASSLTEITAKLIENLELQLDVDSATTLLSGINQTTNYLQHQSVTADTFDLVAKLIRAGAKRPPTNGSVADSPATPLKPPSTATQNGNVPQEWLTPKIYKGSGTRS
jgi:nanoRNase/pAp phosphatase (c-di-AMP/oligoRNAs hydrolase)